MGQRLHKAKMAEKKLRNFDFVRVDSCLSSPQEEVLTAFDSQNLQQFYDILCGEELDVNHEYVVRNHSTLLHMCVSSRNEGFARELLRRKDTNINLPHRVLQKCPLHVAVENGDIGMVRLLLGAGANVNAKMAGMI